MSLGWGSFHISCYYESLFLVVLVNDTYIQMNISMKYVCVCVCMYMHVFVALCAFLM